MVKLQRRIAHAEADARHAAIFAGLLAVSACRSSQAAAGADADLARLRSCSGAMASAWLTALPGPVTGLTDVEFIVNLRLRLGEELLPTLESADSCVCGRAALSGTHCLLCGVLSESLIRRHDILRDAWKALVSCSGSSSSSEPYVGRDAHGIRGMPARRDRDAASSDPQAADTLAPRQSPAPPASVVPSTFLGTQASSPSPSVTVGQRCAAASPASATVPCAGEAPPTTASAVRPVPLGAQAHAHLTPADAVGCVAAARDAGCESAPRHVEAAAGSAAAAPLTAGPVPADVQLGSDDVNPGGTHPHLAAAGEGGPAPGGLADNGGAQQPGAAGAGDRACPAGPADRPEPQRGDLMAFLPTRPYLADVVVAHPLAREYVQAAAMEDGATALRAEARKRTKYGRTGTGVCEFVPLAHETYGRVGPAGFKFLNTLAGVAAGARSVSKRVFMANAMRRLSTALCRGVAIQVRAAAPLRARLLDRPVLVGLAQATDELHLGTGGA